jgi:hypothetical protein
MKKLQRYTMGDHWNCFVEDDDGELCISRDVYELEAKYAQLEASHAELLERAEDISKLLEYFVVTNEYVELTIEHFRAAIAKAKGEVMP